jgi:AraC family transcriptional regulator
MDAQEITNESIISDGVGAPPDVLIRDQTGSFSFARWRNFVGSYQHPPLPDALLVVHTGGKPNVRTWQTDRWSERWSTPGLATLLPSNQPSAWLVDGELDCVTLSISSKILPPSRLSKMQFAFPDYLSSALTRQLLAESYEPNTEDRATYMESLMNMLAAHVMRQVIHGVSTSVPSADASAHRLHKVLNYIRSRPDLDHKIDDLATIAGVAPSHFCRLFKSAMNMTPHNFVTRVRMERAQSLLRQTELPIVQIAEAAGFSNQSAFTRAFNSYTGMAPGQWRDAPTTAPN